MIVCKKNIVNRRGEREQLNVYSSAAECKLTGEPHKIIKRGGKTLGYVGLTRDLDTPKASSKRVKIKDKVYVERKYLGKNTFYNYMQSKYPSSYKTITKITSDMFNEDTSDSESVSNFFAGMSSLESDIQLDTRNCLYFNSVYNSCSNLKKASMLNTSNGVSFSFMYAECKELTEVPLIDTSKGTNFRNMYAGCIKVIEFPALNTSSAIDVGGIYGRCHSAKIFPTLNTRNGTTFDYMYNQCSSATSFPALDTRNGTTFDRMYRHCSSATSFPALDTSNSINCSGMYVFCSKTKAFPQLKTSKCKDFSNMYNGCFNAVSVSDIDLSSISVEDTTTNKKLNNMLLDCNSLPSVTFNNVPVGITVEQMRTATSAPETCEIILNYRSE